MWLFCGRVLDAQDEPRGVLVHAVRVGLLRLVFADDDVAVAAREVDVQLPVGLVVGMEGEAEQAALERPRVDLARDVQEWLAANARAGTQILMRPVCSTMKNRSVPSPASVMNTGRFSPPTRWSRAMLAGTPSAPAPAPTDSREPAAAPSGAGLALADPGTTRAASSSELPRMAQARRSSRGRAEDCGNGVARSFMARHARRRTGWLSIRQWWQARGAEIDRAHPVPTAGDIARGSGVPRRRGWRPRLPERGRGGAPRHPLRRHRRDAVRALDDRIPRPNRRGHACCRPEDTPLVRALQERKPTHQQLHITGIDGTDRSIEVTAFPLEGGRGRLIGAVAMFWERGNREWDVVSGAPS